MEFSSLRVSKSERMIVNWSGAFIQNLRIHQEPRNDQDLCLNVPSRNQKWKKRGNNGETGTRYFLFLNTFSGPELFLNPVSNSRSNHLFDSPNLKSITAHRGPPTWMGERRQFNNTVTCFPSKSFLKINCKKAFARNRNWCGSGCVAPQSPLKRIWPGNPIQEYHKIKKPHI